MKKHYMILGIAVFGGVFALVVYMLQGKGSEFGHKGNPNESTLTVRIENMGKEAFSKKDYQALVNEVEGLKSAQEINAEQAMLYRQNLLINLQSSLAITFEQARLNCYGNDLRVAHQAADSIHYKIDKLTDELKHHKNYNIALGYQGRLNSFLSGGYDDQKAQAIKKNFTSFISGKPFAQCGEIQVLKSRIDAELRKFKQFVLDFNNRKQNNKLKDWFDEDLYPENVLELKHYNAYYQEFIRTKQ
jgi:hypothetical protein